MEFNATFIVSAISFIVFTLIMNAIFYKPLNKVVHERQKFIYDNYEEAKQHKEKAESILTEKSQKIEESKSNAKGIILNKSEEAKAQKTALTVEAQQSAMKAIDEAKGELHASKTQAQDVLSNDVVVLAQNISSKLLGEDIAISKVDNELVGKIIREG